jgi:ABC-2 type transport system permease protein
VTPAGDHAGPDGGARILERGYRRYDGPRKGRRHAVTSLARHSALRALGLRRSAWAKLLPLAVVVLAYLPAVVFLGFAVLLPSAVLDAGVLPDYPEYYRFIGTALILFTALVAPEVLCPDRRSGMVGLYLASPLSRTTYLAAKVLAIAPVLALVTLGPPLVLLGGLVLTGAGPDGPGDVAVLLVRIVAAGVVITAVYTAVSMAAASLTDRRALATAAVVLVLLVSGATTDLLLAGGAPAALALLNVGAMPLELVQRVYGETGFRPALPTSAVLGANVAWLAGAAAVVAVRYRSLRVTR